MTKQVTKVKELTQEEKNFGIESILDIIKSITSLGDILENVEEIDDKPVSKFLKENCFGENKDTKD